MEQVEIVAMAKTWVICFYTMTVKCRYRQILPRQILTFQLKTAAAAALGSAVLKYFPDLKTLSKA